MNRENMEELNFELERAKARVAWLEAVKNMEIGEIYEWEESDRHIVWVLTAIDLEGQIIGVSLYDYDKNGKRSLVSHLVKWSSTIRDGEHRMLTIQEATEVIELAIKVDK